MIGPVDRLAALYRPSADSLRRQLPELADGIHAQLCELATRPSRDKGEALASNLDGVRRHVLRLADAIGREAAA